MSSTEERSRILRSVSLYGEHPTDVSIEGDRITAIGQDMNLADAEVIDCSGLLALPGLVDLHTHLREPGPGDAETIETGTSAAVAGGYSAVFAMANTDPVADSVDVVESVRRRSLESATCDVYPVGAVTVGLAGRELAPLENMAHSAARVRVFSDDGKCVDDPLLMREALARIGHLGGVLAQHAQSMPLAGNGQANSGIAADTLGVHPWPGIAEETIVARDIVLMTEAAPHGSRLHVCHVSTAESVELLRWAKQRNLPVTAEVTPHHLALLDAACLGGDTRFKVNPPLRDQADQAAVRQGLADGIIDIVATDHAPHSLEAKDHPWCDAPPGMLGIETALPVLIETMVVPGHMGWRDVARTMAERPAQIGGIADEHGRPLAVSEPATLCLVDPNAPWTVSIDGVRSIGKNTPFEDMHLSAQIVATLIRGGVAHDRRGLFDARTRPPARTPRT